MSHEDKHLERFLQNNTLYVDQLRHSRKARLLFALSLSCSTRTSPG